MADDSTDAIRRKAAVVLSQLLLTPESGLDAFRERRLPLRAAVDMMHLLRARDVMDALYRMIADGDDADGERLEAAWQALCTGPPSISGPGAGEDEAAPAPPTRVVPVLAVPSPARVPLVEVAASSRGAAAEPTPPSPPVDTLVTAVAAAEAVVTRTKTGPMARQVRPTLPFKRDPAAAPRSIAHEVAAEAESLVGETSTGVPALKDDDVELPFGKKAAAETLDATSFSMPLGDLTESDEAPRTAPAMTGMNADETQISPIMIGLPAGFVIPRPLPALTVEQYASLRAELDRSDTSARAAVLMRYGVSEEQLTAMDDEWKAQFEARPAMYDGFRRAYAAYAAWLASAADPQAKP